MWIVQNGDEYVGPFDTETAAQDWADGQDSEDAAVIELTAP